MPFAATRMDLEGIMLSEISQTGKDKYCIPHLYVESKKYNKLVFITKKKQSHIYREQTNGYQLGEGQYGGEGVGGTNYGMQDSLKDVLYSTGKMANIL